jgi:hypothetical protein
MTRYEGIPLNRTKSISIVLPFSQNEKLKVDYESGKKYFGEVVVFPRNEDQSISKNYPRKELTLGSDSNGQFLAYELAASIDSPLDAGAYDIKFRLFDDKNNMIAEILARWLIEGLTVRIGKITNVTDGKLAFADRIDYTVALFSIFESEDKANLKVVLDLLDSNNKVITSYTKNVLADNTYYEVNFSEFSAQGDISFSKANVSVFDSNGKLLDTMGVGILPEPMNKEDNLSPMVLILIIILLLIVLVVGFTMLKKNKGSFSLFLIILCIILVSTIAFACNCSFTTPGVSNPWIWNGNCCVNVDVQCESCGNCVSTYTANSYCSETGGCGHDDDYCNFTCCQPGYEVFVRVSGGVNATGSSPKSGYLATFSQTYSCCNPVCNYGSYDLGGGNYLKCGQPNGCGGNCSAADVGVGYFNSCDTTDKCRNVRNVGSYNNCDLNSNIPCSTESALQCDGIDNDCDTNVDISAAAGLECSKNYFNISSPNDLFKVGELWYKGNCTNACKICKDNKINTLSLHNVKANSDVNAVNYLTEDNEFRVDINSSSPNNCLTQYKVELLFSSDNGATWNRVGDNNGVGINDFKDTQANFFQANTSTVKNNYFSNPNTPLYNKLSFAQGDNCSTSADCNIYNNEICTNSKCVVFEFVKKCNGDQLQFFNIDNDLYTKVNCASSTGCSVVGKDVNCILTDLNACSERSLTMRYIFDENANLLYAKDCNELNQEICKGGQCCKVLSKTCTGSTLRITDSCGNTTTKVCTTGQTCNSALGLCCAPTGVEYCDSLSKKVMTRDTCGQESVVETCNDSNGYFCLGGDTCCKQTSALTCSGDSTQVLANYSCTDGTNEQKVAQTCSSPSVCNNGACCTPDVSRSCSADLNKIVFTDSCGNTRQQSCSVGEQCVSGYCRATYTASTREGYRVIDTSSKGVSFNFHMLYLPVGYKYKVRAQVIDAKAANNVSGAVYNDNSWIYSNVITVQNTIPTRPEIKNFDRDDLSQKLTALYFNSADPDVFPTGYKKSQDLNYYSRIWQKQYFTPSSPAINCPVGSVLGTEFKNVTENAQDYNYTIDLVAERTYSSDARAYDGIIYSECSVPKDSNETPFNPTCTSLGFSNSISPTVINTPEGKTTLLFDINCDKSQKMVDNKWKVSIENVFVKLNSISVPVSSFISVPDCNSDLQSAKVIFDSNEPGTYMVDFNYGGVYNNVSKWCTSTPIQAVVTGGGNGGGGFEEEEEDILGLVIKDVVVKGYSDGTLDVNFGMSAALATQVTQIDLYKAGTLVNAIYKRPNPPFNVPTTSFLDVSSKFNSSEPKAYSLTITYKGGSVGAGLSDSDGLNQKFLFSAAGSDVVHFDSVPNPERTLTIMFVLTEDGNAVFTPEEITAIPDSNLIVVLLTIIIAIGIISIKRK